MLVSDLKQSVVTFTERKSPENLLVSLVLLSEFGEGGVLLLESLNFNLQLSQPLPQQPGLVRQAWVTQ